jgi:3-hydroxybenzoate 6-monooxygenase
MANGARVRTASGRVYEADAVIGADGVRSKIREQLTGGDPLRVSGHVHAGQRDE